MVEVYAPATSANMGVGFDTMGIALHLYNRIQVEAKAHGLKIINRHSREYLPRNENNLIYQSVRRAFEETNTPLPGLRIVQNSRIPVTRGLGSSSACIVGGLIAGNILSGSKLSRQRLFQIAAEIEGHPDNVAPALLGGLTASTMVGGDPVTVHFPLSDRLHFAALVPPTELSTSLARSVLPDSLTRADTVFNVSRAALVLNALGSGDCALLGVGMEDRVHQPYRLPLIPDFEGAKVI